MKTDEKTLKLIEEVRRQKREIDSAESGNWITNCSFRYTEGNKTINLHVESNVQTLVKIAGFLKSSESYYLAAAKEMGVEAPQYLWDGFSVADWLKDIKRRIDRIQIASKKRKLELLETRLNAVISPELRTQLELEEIDKLLAE